MCQKLWKLAGSRQSYSKNDQAYFLLFWPTLYIIVFLAFCQVFPLHEHRTYDTYRTDTIEMLGVHTQVMRSTELTWKASLATTPRLSVARWSVLLTLPSSMMVWRTYSVAPVTNISTTKTWKYVSLFITTDILINLQSQWVFSYVLINYISYTRISVVVSLMVSTNEAALHRVCLILGWVTVGRLVYQLCM